MLATICKVSGEGLSELACVFHFTFCWSRLVDYFPPLLFTSAFPGYFVLFLVPSYPG